MRSKKEILAVTLLTGIIVALAMALNHASAASVPAGPASSAVSRA
jgi:Spy/CpxP family protein refolding chaperone